MASRLPAGCACRRPSRWTSPRARRPAARPDAMRAYGAGVRAMAGMVLAIAATGCATRGTSVNHRMLLPQGGGRVELESRELFVMANALGSESGRESVRERECREE